MAPADMILIADERNVVTVRMLDDCTCRYGQADAIWGANLIIFLQTGKSCNCSAFNCLENDVVGVLLYW